ncbi:MAG: threonine--tRNA ligase, partial [Candidatus Paceibacteria bacterium]
STKKELDNYLKFQEELSRRDHRKLGEELELFSFDPIAPAAPIWLPKGMIIFKELEKFWREIHDSAGYQEISTPIMVKEEIFQKSGHIEHYRENMFLVKVGDENYYLKPMNCPESTLVYAKKIRSYRDLPLRFSEIGRLHRNELAGTLGGMLRVRQLTMDDAHIYCRPDQILSEISGVLKLVKLFYKIFGFKPVYKLATRPDKAMGDPKLWKEAERDLAKALNKNKLKYVLKPKDGAFYGPKIDIHIEDAIGRDWQMATIQLDFQMPERFGLEYIDKDGKKKQPVMIHRAIFGSFERFLGILLEHYAGALPLWLSPIQAAVIPVGSADRTYAKKVGRLLSENNVRVEIWDQNETVPKRIRDFELQKIPYALVVGKKEKKLNAVRVRERKRGDIGMVKLERFANRIIKEIEDKK